LQDSQGLNLSLEERVRRKLILVGILPKLSDLGQGAIGEAIEAAGAGQFGRLLVSEAVFLSLTARDASTSQTCNGQVMSIATAQPPFGVDLPRHPKRSVVIPHSLG
jgi:hypothetical protein